MYYFILTTCTRVFWLKQKQWGVHSFSSKNDQLYLSYFWLSLVPISSIVARTVCRQRLHSTLPIACIRNVASCKKCFGCIKFRWYQIMTESFNQQNKNAVIFNCFFEKKAFLTKTFLKIISSAVFTPLFTSINSNDFILNKLQQKKIVFFCKTQKKKPISSWFLLPTTGSRVHIRWFKINLNCGPYSHYFSISRKVKKWISATFLSSIAMLYMASTTFFSRNVSGLGKE